MAKLADTQKKGKKNNKKKRANPRKNDDNKSTMTDMTALTEHTLVMDNNRPF